MGTHLIKMHPKSILDQYGLSAKKSLGQNFLFDDHILSRIANAAELNGGDDVLEIGPGFGSLTRHLSDAAGRVVAVEIDGRFIPILNDRLADLNNVELIQADILEFSASQLFSIQLQSCGEYPILHNRSHTAAPALKHSPTVFDNLNGSARRSRTLVGRTGRYEPIGCFGAVGH